MNRATENKAMEIIGIHRAEDGNFILIYTSTDGTMRVLASGDADHILARIASELNRPSWASE